MKKPYRGLRSDKVERIPALDVISFDATIEDLLSFCSIIDDQDDINQTLMKNYVMIRLVSIVEFNLKAFVSKLIDDLDLKPEEILRDDSISINLDILQNFKSDFYSKGRIITASLDKMNPGLIYSIMSRINHLDFFCWYDALMQPHQGKTWTQFNDLYAKRNDMIHNLVDVDDSIPVLRDKVIQFHDFVYFLFIFTEMNIGINVKKEPESKILKRWSALDQSKIKLTLNNYKQITKKFRDNYSPPRRS
jgi:hypothetical protein